MMVQSKGITPWFLRGILILAMAVLVGRLGELQIIKGTYFRDLAEGNRIRRVPIAAQRGEIHARGGELLVGNSEITKKLKFSPEKGFEKVDGDTGDLTISEFVRQYNSAGQTAHVTGYVGEVGKDEVGKVDSNCPEKGTYGLGSLIGKTGLEEMYQCTLAGIDGEELFEVDSSGNMVRSLGKKPAIPGTKLVTNIDYGLQKKIASAMEGKVGVAVATDASGEILAMYSSPSYDPNLFVNNSDRSQISKLLDDKNKPFFNRVISGTYHPGSVFKPLVALAALEEAKIDPKFTYEDTGQIIVESGETDYSYANWLFTRYGGVEGSIGVTRALARSTDTFFYKVGELLGPDKIAQWAGKLGLSQRTRIDLPGEALNLIPTPAWKKEVRGESWFLGNTYHVSIGQGDLALTPVSINMMTQAIATGFLCHPKLVGKADCQDLGLKLSNRNIVLSGMIDACSSGGTAGVFFEWNRSQSKVACKTGTAQTGNKEKTHAWFTVVWPAMPDLEEKTNQITMTVLVEEGGEGSVVAAPIAKDILEYLKSR